MIKDYMQFVENSTIREIELIANKLKKIKVLHINSTKQGGGVAEILHRLVPLMNEIGIETHWEVFEGDRQFFSFTKKLHNLLHIPGKFEIDSKEIVYYFKTTYKNLDRIKTEGYDVIFVHDPQPMGLIVNRKKGQKWIWRCHVDTSTPDPNAWKFLEIFLNAYDACIFHMPEFVYEKIKIPVFTIRPSIDPLHPKNKSLNNEEIKKIITKFGINPKKPFILQVSRFDKLKDPFGVVEAYKIVKKKYDIQLVLLGALASDDPEGEMVLKNLLEYTKLDKDIFILNLPPDSYLEVNAFQRAATVVIQKSLREGFGLVVSEAMWKGKPVIGSNVGGIKRQIVHGITGYLVNSIEGTAWRIKQLLANPELRKTMGKHGIERVRHRFLIIRHLRDYLLLILNIINHHS